MPIQTINLGNYANDGTGDDLRTAFTKVNNNFALLDAEVNINSAENVGAGVGVLKQVSSGTVYLKTLRSSDGSVVITSETDQVDIQSLSRLNTDPSPSLIGNLSLNGYAVTGPGDLQATVFNYNIPNIHSMVAMILESNTVNIDFGSFTEPAGIDTEPNNRGYVVDMGLFIDTPPTSNQFNFGSF